jgi:TonB-linked SusC/RagA family outer membrane protein
VRKRDLTGSVQSLKTKDLTAIPTNNVLEALQGKVSGVDLTKTSGQAGSGVSFTIRGNRSLKASNDPLVIVDGFPYGNTIDINPTDIESIEILKDAASTAIYGTRGANGVILITTKKGRNEKARVNFSAYYTINNVTDYIPSFDAEGYIQHRMEGARTTNGNEMATGTFVANPYKPLDQVFSNATERQYIENRQFEDWLAMIFSTGHTQNYELNITGGSETTQYSTSLGFMQEEGVIPNDQMKRFNARVSLNQKIFKTLTFGANIMYSYKNQDAGFSSAFNQAGKMIPIAKCWNDDGTLNLWAAPGYSTKLNPIYYFETPHSWVNNTLNKRAIINADLNWEIIPGLTAKTLFSADLRDQRYGFYNENREASPSSGSDDELYTGYQTQNLLTYTKDVNQHHFQVMAGQEFQTWFRENASARGGQQTTPLTSFHFIQSNTTGQAISSQLTESSLMSFFGRINYRFTERYMFNFSLRADRSSVLAEGHQWGYFPSAAAAWRINEESFLKDVSAISNLKLRLSWGVSGNAAIDPYQTQGGLGIAYNTFANTTAGGYYPNDFANNDLSWETTSSYNIALDYGFIKNRLNGSIDFFVANTGNLLLSSKLPTTSGYSSKMENVGSTKNVGIEGNINAIIIQNGNNGFNWTLDVNASHVKEEITALTSGQDRDEVNSWFVGEPLRVYYDYKKIGIWQIDEYAEAQRNSQTYGEIKVADSDGDGSITPDDRVVYNRSPKIVFGINNTFSYKNFDLTAFVFGRLGQWISVSDYGQVFWNGLENSPVHDYWTPENPTNSYPRPHSQRSTGQYPYGSTLNYADGSFIKLRDITLGYTLPQPLLQKMNISQLRFYVSAKNYAMWTKIEHYDPERGGSESWPMFKQVIFGLNLNF